jgi:hypothetical protein
MKKLFIFAACLLALNTAQAQYATIRIKDNTGYTGGVNGQLGGSYGPCIPDNLVAGWGIPFSTAGYTTYTTSSFTGSWVHPGPIPSVFTMLNMSRDLGGGVYEFGSTGPIALCGIPPTGRTVPGTFVTSGITYTVNMIPVAGGLDISITP